MTSVLNPCVGDIDVSNADFELYDLKLLFCGHERCMPGHSWGPDMRSHYVFHLILSGKGVFQSGGKSFSLCEGQGFMLYPETPVYYSADAEQPWEYVWVGFTGRSAVRIVDQTPMSPSLPVIAYLNNFDRERGLLFEIVNSMRSGGAESIIESYGLFLQFMSYLARERGVNPDPSSAAPRSTAEQYVERAKDFIRENLQRDITTSDVSAHLGLNRSYFCKIFTQISGKPPSRFITWYRLNTAWHLLRYTRMPVAEIARHVGYNDPAYFSRCFSQSYGITPGEARKGG